MIELKAPEELLNRPCGKIILFTAVSKVNNELSVLMISKICDFSMEILVPVWMIGTKCNRMKRKKHPTVRHTDLLMWTRFRWKIGTNQITVTQRVGVREISGHLKGEKVEDLAGWGRTGKTEDYGSQSLDPKIILSVYWTLCAVGQRPVWDIKLSLHSCTAVWTCRIHFQMCDHHHHTLCFRGGGVWFLL